MNFLSRFVPFVLSAVLFMTAFFAVFAPLPLILLSTKVGWIGLGLAIASNGLLSFLLGGPGMAVSYVLLVGGTSLGIYYFLIEKKFRIETTVTLTLFGIFGVVLAGLGLFHYSTGGSIFDLVGGQLDQVMSRMDFSSNPEVMKEYGSVEELKNRILQELPSAAAILCLVLIAVNLTLVLKINPDDLRKRLGISDTIFSQWRAPEFLVWPTIAAGGIVVFTTGWTSMVGLNVFKFLMAIYAIQGLSIFSFFMESWKLQTVLRSVLFLLVFFLALPLLLAIGFFDLWFDFRSRVTPPKDGPPANGGSGGSS